MGYDPAMTEKHYLVEYSYGSDEVGIIRVFDSEPEMTAFNDGYWIAAPAETCNNTTTCRFIGTDALDVIPDDIAEKCLDGIAEYEFGDRLLTGDWTVVYGLQGVYICSGHIPVSSSDASIHESFRGLVYREVGFQSPALRNCQPLVGFWDWVHLTESYAVNGSEPGLRKTAGYIVRAVINSTPITYQEIADRLPEAMRPHLTGILAENRGTGLIDEINVIDGGSQESSQWIRLNLDLGDWTLVGDGNRTHAFMDHVEIEDCLERIAENRDLITLPADSRMLGPVKYVPDVIRGSWVHLRMNTLYATNCAALAIDRASATIQNLPHLWNCSMSDRSDDRPVIPDYEYSPNE
jgi:hypothetical protein